MTAPAVIQATFSDFRTVKGRKQMQLIFEVPIERGQEVLMTLGMPDGADPKWCAIALLDMTPVKEPKPSAKEIYASKTDMEKAVMRAGLLCGDQRFQEWIVPRITPTGIIVGDPTETTADHLRSILRIESRSEIADNKSAYRAFIELEAAYRQATGQMAEAR